MIPIHEKLSTHGKQVFADALGCSLNGARNIVYGRSVPGVDKAKIVEAITNGLVTVEMLRG